MMTTQKLGLFWLANAHKRIRLYQSHITRFEIIGNRKSEFGLSKMFLGIWIA